MPISEHRSAFFVACILMHDGFYAAHNVAHRFIEYPAVRGLTQCNFERHSSHQRFLISCNKLHATGLHKIKCGGFFWRFKRCWNPPHFLGFNIVRHNSVHLDARWISHRTQCHPQILSNILPFWPNVTLNVILHINDSWFRATSCTLRGR